MTGTVNSVIERRYTFNVSKVKNLNAKALAVSRIFDRSYATIIQF